MMKRIFTLGLCCLLLCGCSDTKKEQVSPPAKKEQVTASAKQPEVEMLKEDYASKKYVGRYVLRSGLHANDPFVLNHLVAYKNQQINYVNGTQPDYMLYDVYCDHDHAGDVQEVQNDAAINRVSFTGYIIPLNVKGKPMLGKGKYIQNSIIVSKALIATQGTWGFESISLKTYNNTDKGLIMEIKGYAGAEELYRGSAAVDIVNLTAPHKQITKVAGRGDYRFK